MKKTGIPMGFSLVELIIVIALLSIVSAFAVPVWQRYAANTDLKTAAREVMADLSNAKQQAVEENLDVYRLTFNVAGNNYALSRTDTGATSWTKSAASFGNGILIGSVNFSGGSMVSFQKRGTVSMGNLTLRNGLGSTATITVNITGRSYVQFNMQ
jgi:prepilin-type N-terminal cleavage/methylation domain-containing protein